MAYVGGFYGNLSNYHSFGHMKFVPKVDQAVFLTILKSSPNFEIPTSKLPSLIADVYPVIQKEIFALEKPYTQLNFPQDGGVTAYFGRNLDKADLAFVTEFLRN